MLVFRKCLFAGLLAVLLAAPARLNGMAAAAECTSPG